MTPTSRSKTNGTAAQATLPTRARSVDQDEAGARDSGGSSAPAKAPERDRPLVESGGILWAGRVWERTS